MLGVEAGGRGTTLGEHAARLAAAEGFTGARPGVLQGTYTYLLQSEEGQIATTHSISAGLDYPAVGPEHAWLADQHRAEYTAVGDDAAVAAARLWPAPKESSRRSNRLTPLRNSPRARRA